MQDWKMRNKYAGVENAGLENAGNDIVWNAAHCLCLLSFAGSTVTAGTSTQEVAFADVGPYCDLLVSFEVTR